MRKAVTYIMPRIQKYEPQLLFDNRINNELYAFLRERAIQAEGYEFIVYKGFLPSQAEICSAIGIGSPKTLRIHLQQIVESGLIKEVEDAYCLLSENFTLPFKTMCYLNDIFQEWGIEIYLYLGQKFIYEQKNKVPIEELAQKIKLPFKSQDRKYECVENVLTALENAGLIFYRDGILLNFSFYIKNL